MPDTLPSFSTFESPDFYSGGGTYLELFVKNIDNLHKMNKSDYQANYIFSLFLKVTNTAMPSEKAVMVSSHLSS